MLEINNVSKFFSKFKAVNEFTYKFDNGVYALLGPNGAGKSTLLRCITNLYSLTSGKITFDGIDIKDNKDFSSNIGYLPQSFGLFRELKVYEGLELIANIKNFQNYNIDKVLELVNLEEKRMSKIGSLSGGMVRRLGIAQAIMGDPKVVIFDEPTAGLDPEERLRFKNIVNKIKNDKLIIISTHIVDDVEALCDKIVIMNAGSVVSSGSCEDIKNIASGKIYVVETDKINKINSDYHIIQQFEENGIKLTKILSDNDQKLKKVSPTLEDGYVCALRNI
jgi:ABC-2 type transport system ATP-binding protein